MAEGRSMEANYASRLAYILKCSAALTVAAGWFCAVASLALAQPPRERVMLFKGSPRSDYVIESEAGLDAARGIMVLKGAKQTEVAPRPALEVRERAPVTSNAPPPRNLDPLVIQAATPRYPDTRPTIPTTDEDWKYSRPRRFTGSGSTSGT